MQTKIETVTVDTPIIKNPKQNYVYELKAEGLPEGKVTLLFKGKTPASLESMNMAALSWVTREGEGFQSADDADSLEVTAESLPPGSYDPELYPLVVFLKHKKQFNCVAKRTFDFDTRAVETLSYAIVGNIEPANPRLVKECQFMSKGVPVKSDGYPIFQGSYKPSREFLFDLYHRFWKYNRSKLDEQCKISVSRCYLRAHFISFLLSLYGIDSLKIYKSWERADWQEFNVKEDDAWYYHCAVMIIDSENKKWVWDTWIGKNRELLELDEWLLQKGSPVPRKLVIANRAVMTDYKNGAEANLSFHYATASVNQIVFKGLLVSATPNPPVKPISSPINPSSFFNSSQKQNAAVLLLEYKGHSQAKLQ